MSPRPVALRVAPDSQVVRLGCKRPMPAVNAYVVDAGADRILVDTGHAASAELLLEVLRSLLGPARLTAIVLTHGHRDHAGGLARIAAETGAPVYAHPAEIPYLAGSLAYGGLRRSWLYWLSRQPSAAWAGSIRPLAEGERLGPLVALHTPGHTPGHLVLWHEGERTAICGDLLMTAGGRLSGPPLMFTADPGLNRQSVGRLLGLGPLARLCPAHGEPLAGGVTEGIRRYLA